MPALCSMGETTPENEGDDKPKKKRLRPTTKQIIFCQALAAGQTRTAAFMAAYGEFYERKGEKIRRSLDASRTEACKLLRKPHIARELERARKESTKTLRMDARKWLKGLIERSVGDVIDLYEADPDTGLPSPKKLGDLTPAQRRLIKTVKVKKRRIKGKGGLIEEVENAEYITHDPFKAAELIGKHLGYLKEPDALETILNALPSVYADVIRKALADALAQGGGEKPTG